MRKKLIVISMTLIMALSLSACGEKSENKQEEKTTKAETTTVSADSKTQDGKADNSDFKAVDVSVAGWTMSVDNVQIAPELSNTSEVLGYSSASSTTFDQKANEGNTYVLIKMTIKKDGASENIQWDNMLLTDAEGNNYNRIDDSFIDSLTWKRMSGTDLNFGSHEGWFAYEIPEDKSTSGLVLSYKFKDGTMEYKVN